MNATYTSILGEPKAHSRWYEVTVWRYVEDTAWHVKATRKRRHWNAKA